MQVTDTRTSDPAPRDLPRPPAPVGAYSAVVIRGGLGFVSGQFPLADGIMLDARPAPGETALARLQAAARLAAGNVLAQIHKALGGWARFDGLCRVDGIIAAPPGFTAYAAVLDAASQLFVQHLGPALGAHARSATAAAGLPGGACVELVVTFAVTEAQAAARRA